MSYFLDTNICIYFLKGMFPKLLAYFQKVSPEDIKIASIVNAELLLGAYKSNARVKTEEKVSKFLLPYEIVPFDSGCSMTYAKIRADLETSGKIIGANDLILSATVLANNGTLVTNNEEEFTRIKNLKVVNWTK
jgi:tRNA(fMet)-specific endonuclease VapC